MISDNSSNSSAALMGSWASIERKDALTPKDWLLIFSYRMLEDKSSRDTVTGKDIILSGS